MPGATLNLVLDLGIIPGEITSAGAVPTIAHSIADLTVDSEMDTMLGLTTAIMLVGITPAAAVDSPMISGGEEMTTAMPISLVVLPVDQ